MLHSRNRILQNRISLRKTCKKEKILLNLPKVNNNLFTFRFLVPSNWNFYLFLNYGRNLYVIKLVHETYYYTFSLTNLPSLIIYFNTFSRVFSFTDYTLIISKSSWCKELNEILFLCVSFYFLKIKFRGKGYYIYKNKRNTIAPQFGYFHRVYIYSFFNFVKFLTKTKILIFGVVKKDALIAAHNIKKKRPINIFTGKGVRFAKQIIYKKTGKVSAYR